MRTASYGELAVSSDWRAFYVALGTVIIDIQVRNNPDRYFLTVTEDPDPPRPNVMEKYLIKFGNENADFPDARVFGPHTVAGDESGVVWLHKIGCVLMVPVPGTSSRQEPELASGPSA